MDNIVMLDFTGIHAGFTDEQAYDAIVAKAFPNWACASSESNDNTGFLILSPPTRLALE